MFVSLGQTRFLHGRQTTILGSGCFCTTTLLPRYNRNCGHHREALRCRTSLCRSRGRRLPRRPLGEALRPPRIDEIQKTKCYGLLQPPCCRFWDLAVALVRPVLVGGCRLCRGGLRQGLCSAAFHVEHSRSRSRPRSALNGPQEARGFLIALPAVRLKRQRPRRLPPCACPAMRWAFLSCIQLLVCYT